MLAGIQCRYRHRIMKNRRKTDRYSIYFIVSLFCAAVAAIYVPLLDDKTAPASLPNHPRQFATAPET